MAGARILGVVVCNLSYWEEPGPIVLLKVNKGLEVRFHCIILLFRWAVRLRVIGGGEPPLDAEEVAERRPEF